MEPIEKDTPGTIVTVYLKEQIEQQKALPEMGKHIAWEDVYLILFLTAVITTRPFKKSENLWVRNVHLLT